MAKPIVACAFCGNLALDGETGLQVRRIKDFRPRLAYFESSEQVPGHGFQVETHYYIDADERKPTGDEEGDMVGSTSGIFCGVCFEWSDEGACIMTRQEALAIEDGYLKKLRAAEGGAISPDSVREWSPGYAASPRIQTPWGLSDDGGTEYAPGVVFYSAPSHGGCMLSPERQAAMPKPLRDAARYAGPGWYEEDCEAALVVIAFPDLFPPDMVERCRASVRSWYPKAYGAWTGLPVEPTRT